MALKEVVPGLYRVSLGMVSAYLLQDGQELTLIDTGVRGAHRKILAAVAELGRRPQDIKHILITHLHADHTGGLAALKRETVAPVYMHQADAKLVRQGIASRRPESAPNPIVSVIVRYALRQPQRVEPCETDHLLADGDVLPVGGGLCVVGAPGHAAGQVVFLWPEQGGVLIAGDAASNFRGKLGYPMLWENEAEGLRTLEKLAGLEFQTAVFGHGAPILRHASDKFLARWGRAVQSRG